MTTLLKQSTAQMDIEIGHRIRDFRKIRGVSQDRLGDALGVSFQQIQKYESGKNRVATSTLVKICQALEIDSGDVIGRYFTDAAVSVGLVESVAEDNKLLKAKLARIHAIVGDIDAPTTTINVSIAAPSDWNSREIGACHQ